MILCKVDIGTNHLVQRLLDTYGQASGQWVDTDKTAIVFSKNTPANIKEEIRAFWTNEIVQ